MFHLIVNKKINQVKQCDFIFNYDDNISEERKNLNEKIEKVEK